MLGGKIRRWRYWVGGSSPRMLAEARGNPLENWGPEDLFPPSPENAAPANARARRPCAAGKPLPKGFRDPPGFHRRHRNGGSAKASSLEAAGARPENPYVSSRYGLAPRSRRLSSPNDFHVYDRCAHLRESYGLRGAQREVEPRGAPVVDRDDHDPSFVADHQLGA